MLRRGVTLEKGGGQLLEAQVVRSVLAFGKLLEHDFALLCELVRKESCVEIHIREHFHALCGVNIARQRVVTGAALCGVGVYLRAEGIDFVCDVEGGALFRALEKHVLQKMRDATLLRTLVNGARLHENAHRRGAHGGVRSHNQPQTAVESYHFTHGAIIPHIDGRAIIICNMSERRFRLVISNIIICTVLAVVLTSAIVMLNPDTPVSVEVNSAIYEGNPESGRVALMFNVYEGTEYVEKIAALFSERGWNTTFFVGGKWAERNGDTLLRLAADGFELGNHGYLHRDHATLGMQANRDEILLTERLMKATLKGLDPAAIDAAVPPLFAPPSGSMGDNMFRVCEALGYKVVMWTRDTIDWRDHDAKLIATRALDGIKAGDLILMHPTEKTVEALPAILDKIAAAGLVADTVTATIAATADLP